MPEIGGTVYVEIKGVEKGEVSYTIFYEVDLENGSSGVGGGGQIAI